MTAAVYTLLHHDETAANGNDAISIAIREKEAAVMTYLCWMAHKWTEFALHKQHNQIKH